MKERMVQNKAKAREQAFTRGFAQGVDERIDAEMEVTRIMDDAHDDEVLVMYRRMMGWGNKEIAEDMGETSKTVEHILWRLKSRERARHERTA